MTDGAATATFDVPGSVGGKPLQGTVRVDATWGTTTEDTKITVAGSELTPSVSEVLPNESITISGNGYGSQTCINVAKITLDNVAVQVDSESTIKCSTGSWGLNATTFDAVEVSNSGQFVATITLWPNDQSAGNPTLIAGSHELTRRGQPGLHRIDQADHRGDHDCGASGRGGPAGLRGHQRRELAGGQHRQLQLRADQDRDLRRRSDPQLQRVR